MRNIRYKINTQKSTAFLYTNNEKAEKENKESKKEYYTEYAKGYLIRGEEYEQIPIYLKEAEETYKKRADEIENLRQEYKVIRKLRV